MKKKTIIALILVLAAPSFAQTADTDMPPARMSLRLIELQATVEKIDTEKQEVTLKGPRGNKVTLSAANVAERLHEIKVGDTVQANYWTFLRAEFREPTAKEKKSPLMDLTGVYSLPKDVKFPGEVKTVVKAVVTVTAIDREGKRVTIQGPRGKFLTLPARDERILRDLKVGQLVVVTYADAVALSLEKVSKNKGIANEN